MRSRRRDRLPRVLPSLTSAVGAAALLAAAALPAAAHGDAHTDEDRPDAVVDGAEVGGLSSERMTLLDNEPGRMGIAGCFMPTAPIFVMSSLDQVTVFDASDPADPQVLGVLPNVVFENEAMNCGERRTSDGVERFALVGVDLYDVSTSIQHTASSTGGKELLVVDVTDPANPSIRSSTSATTGTHTVACVDDRRCDYAYSSGGRTEFSIFDLTDLDDPHEVDADQASPGVQPFVTPTGGHKWNFDASGHGIHTGYEGSGIFDVSEPRDPQLVTTTGEAGRGLAPDGTPNGYNDFIHHNSARPNADRFVPDAPPSLANGNVLLVTEEDYMETDCSRAGSFQTWWVKRLDGTPEAIVPLDKVELADLGSYPVSDGAFCSAHWFDVHQSGVVAVGFYGGGTQLVDVSDPGRIEPFGHSFWGASEVWDAYWVPEYNGNDNRTGRKSDVVWSVDLVRGLDAYRVDLDGTDEGLLTALLR